MVSFLIHKDDLDELPLMILSNTSTIKRFTKGSIPDAEVDSWINSSTNYVISYDMEEYSVDKVNKLLKSIGVNLNYVQWE